MGRQRLTLANPASGDLTDGRLWIGQRLGRQSAYVEALAGQHVRAQALAGGDVPRRHQALAQPGDLGLQIAAAMPLTLAAKPH